jgi:hypothetical protein
VSKVNVRFQRPGTISTSGRFDFHGKGFLVYGLPTPQSDRGLELTNVASVLPGRLNPAGDRENGLFRQTELSVITSDSFEVSLKTTPVRLLGSDAMRDVDADGDEGFLKLDGGRDVNGNGTVDFKTPETTEYGFERFVTKHQPLIGNHDVRAPRGDGEFRQVIDATRLEEGVHFLTARVYRHRPGGAPAVFSDFKKVIYVDRRPPVSALNPIRRINAQTTEISVQSLDLTANTVHVFTDLPVATTEDEIVEMASQGRGRLNGVDRGLFSENVPGLAPGSHALTILTFEQSGRRSITRVTANVP